LERGGEKEEGLMAVECSRRTIGVGLAADLVDDATALTLTPTPSPNQKQHPNNSLNCFVVSATLLSY
jgi:hypothetical protein